MADLITLANSSLGATITSGALPIICVPGICGPGCIAAAVATAIFLALSLFSSFAILPVKSVAEGAGAVWLASHSFPLPNETVSIFSSAQSFLDTFVSPGYFLAKAFPVTLLTTWVSTPLTAAFPAPSTAAFSTTAFSNPSAAAFPTPSAAAFPA